MRRAVIVIMLMVCGLALAAACSRGSVSPKPTPAPVEQKTPEEIAAEHAALLATIEYEPYADLNELKAEAQVVFIGVVEQVAAPVSMVLFYMGDNSDTPFYYAHTVTELRVEQVVKGELSAGDTIKISQPGAVGKADFFMVNEVLLTEGARGLFFAVDNPLDSDGCYNVLRYEQSVFKIVDDTIMPNFVQDGLRSSWALGEVVDYLEGKTPPAAAPEVIAAADPPAPAPRAKVSLGLVDSDYSVVNAFWVDERNVLVALSKTLPVNGVYTEYGQLLLLNTESQSQQIVFLGPMKVTPSDQLLYDNGEFVYQSGNRLIFMDEGLTVRQVMEERVEEHRLRLSPDLLKTAQVIDGVVYITGAAQGEILARYEDDGSGLVWAPDSTQVAFLGSDQRSVVWLGGERFAEQRVLTLGQSLPQSGSLTALTGCAFTDDSAHLVLWGRHQLQAEMMLYNIATGENQIVALASDMRLVDAGDGDIWYLNQGVESSFMHYSANASGGSMSFYSTPWPVLAADHDRERDKVFLVEYEYNQQQLYLLDVSPQPESAEAGESGDSATAGETVTAPPPGAEADERVTTPPPGVEENERVTAPPPGAEENERVTAPPPDTEEDETITRPPPGVEEDETVTAPPPGAEAAAETPAPPASEPLRQYN